MQKIISLREIEGVYKVTVKKQIDNGNALTPDSLIDLSLNLFENVKAKGLSSVEEKDTDMLLFQYGTYDWGDENGEYFSFEIARQFILAKNHEFYQLRFNLIFGPKDFKDCDSYERWSRDFTDLHEWVTNIKSTQGYEIAKSIHFRSYEILLDKI